MKLLLIDGNSIVNRSYYAIKALANKKGIATNAVTGFLNTLIKLQKMFEPALAAVAFDMRAPTFRHEMYDGYKAKRKGMPDDLAAQLPYIKQILTAWGVAYTESEGWEADDIIGTLAKNAENAGVDVIIATGDRDAFQLISERVSVNLAATKEEILYTPEKIKEVYGITPPQMIEVKALMGDASDNIPGVAGIGEKTAYSLIQKYESVDKIYGDISALDVSAGIKSKLEKDKDMCFLSRRLGIIAQDAPVSLTLDDYRIKGRDENKLAEILTELEMFALMKKLKLEAVTQSAIPDKRADDAVNITPAAPITPPDNFNPALAAYLLNVNEAAYTPERLYREINTAGLNKLLFDVEIPLIDVLAEMEAIGVKLDADGVKSFGKRLEAEINDTEEKIYKLSGGEFNISSPKQLGEVLFVKLGLPGAKKTKTGYSTNAEILEELADSHPVIPLVLEYRRLTKLNSTYVHGLLTAVKPDGRIHSTFKQTEARTGRLSSAEPNIQNIPVRTERGREMRRFFVAEEGYVLVDADYSQIELRVLAHISGDEIMRAAFANSDDIHTITASQVFNAAPAAVTRQQRTAAKAVNFGIVYGIGAFSLSKDIGVSVSEADRYIKQYLAKYSGVDRYMKRVIAECKQNGFVTTLMNRRRYIPEINSLNKNIEAMGKRLAMNTPIQGTAADIIKIAMVNVHNRLKAENLKARLILQVHDELIVEAPEAEADKATALVKEEMTAAGHKLGVTLEVDAETGKTWYDTH